MNPARRTLDPRAKLYLLLVANLMLFFHVGLATQIVMVVLCLLPLRVYVHHHVRERVHLRDAAYARA